VVVSPQQVAAHLPYLRRFARAVTGSQEQGDACVSTVLEQLIAAPDAIPSEGRARLALYKSLVKVLNETAATAGSPSAVKADARLQMLAPAARQAFLLVTLEELSPSETADVLGVSDQKVTELLDIAGRDIASQIATDVLIIEDEHLIALDLKEIVTNLGHRVPEIVRSRSEAVEAIKRVKPGLVLADIHLADGSSGLDAVNDILSVRQMPVIFITAYPERLLTGRRPEPTFLITKPFQSEVVKAIVSQALFFDVQSARALS
jgi:DNA-directed RNA polymerase specialized sigma24 family protein/CheY-like chemotaxis protein